MNADHLIELAEQILQIGAGRPKQATINRAVSTAYYALFHALAGECVARLVGSPRSRRYWEVVSPVHRAIDHGAAWKTFERLARDRATSSNLKALAEIFVELQSARHSADYDPACRHSRREAQDFIDQARRAIEALGSLPKEDRLVLVVQLITKPR